MSVERVAFIGMRIGDPTAYAATVAFYRDLMRLALTLDDGLRSTRFVLDDRAALHVYGPADEDHLDFGMQV